MSGVSHNLRLVGELRHNDLSAVGGRQRILDRRERRRSYQVKLLLESEIFRKGSKGGEIIFVFFEGTSGAAKSSQGSMSGREVLIKKSKERPILMSDRNEVDSGFRIYTSAYIIDV